MAGKHYEELTPGLEFRHPIARTVTEADNLLFNCLTMNTQPLHLDEEHSKATFYGTRIVNSVFTLGLVGGLAVTDMTLGTTLGNLGFDAVEFPKPVFHGDTIHAESTVVDRRESKSRPDAGIVWIENRGINQRGEVVCRSRRAALMLKQPTD